MEQAFVGGREDLLLSKKLTGRKSSPPARAIGSMRGEYRYWYEMAMLAPRREPYARYARV
jgi:hypothetical protein